MFLIRVSLLRSHQSTCLSSLITLNHPSVTSRLKISNRSFSTLLLSYEVLFLLTYVMPPITPLLLRLFLALASLTSPFLYLKELKSHIFRISFPAQPFHFIQVHYYLISTHLHLVHPCTFQLVILISVCE
jgi:hypothetical protein